MHFSLKSPVDLLKTMILGLVRMSNLNMLIG